MLEASIIFCYSKEIGKKNSLLMYVLGLTQLEGANNADSPNTLEPHFE